MILGELIEALKDMFFSFLYTCFMFICKLIDFIKDIFYMLCGIDPVEVNGEPGDLLSTLIQSDAIKRTFLTIFIIGIILLVAFTIIAIVKANYQEKQNWLSVLKKSGQSFIIAVLIHSPCKNCAYKHRNEFNKHSHEHLWRGNTRNNRCRQFHWIKQGRNNSQVHLWRT